MGGKKRKKPSANRGEKVKPGPKKVLKTPGKNTRQYRESDREYRQLKRKSNGDKFDVPEKRSKPETTLKCVTDFHQAIQDVCNNVCFSCGGLFYRFSVHIRSIEWIQEKLLAAKSKVSAGACADYVDSLLDNGVFYLCDYCQRSVDRGKLPILSIYNGIGFPDVPSFVQKLTDLQEKLVAPRIEFARIQRVGKGGQKGLLGNIVNVAHDIDTSVKVIPRQFHELSVVNVEFMRRSQYSFPYAKERISPLEVLIAAKYLVNTPVYKDLGVKLSDAWERERSGQYLDVPTVYIDKSKKDRREISRPFHSKFAIAVGSDDDTDDSDTSEDDLDTCETDNGDGFSELPSGSNGKFPSADDRCSEDLRNMSSMGSAPSTSKQCSLSVNKSDTENDSSDEETHDSSKAAQSGVDMSHSNARFFSENQTLLMDLNSAPLTVRFAPCEDEKPIPLNCDKNPDILAFPSVYGGQWRNFKLKPKPSIKKIKKFELRYHRRPTRSVLHLFQGFKMCFNYDIQNCVRVLLRKQAGEKHLTASDAMNADVLKSVFTEDRGYSAFKQVRCTPAYWQAQGNKAVAMGRQFGKATFFITLSAAENHWADLIVALLDVVKHVKTSYSDVKKWLEADESDKPDIGLSSGLIYELISSDPVTCVRHFDRRFRCFQKHVLKSADGVFPFAMVEDFFWRVEFQQRGSPHLHGVTWNQNAPVFDVDDLNSFRLKGLYIQDGVFREPSPASKHDKVEVELRHLKNVPFVPGIQTFPTDVNTTKIFFANITSFKPIVKDLEADIYLTQCDILVFVEPRLLDFDSVAIKGYDIVTRVNCRSTRNSEGVLCFRAERLNKGTLSFDDIYQDYEENGHLMVAHWRFCSLHLYVFYKSPGYSLSKCKQYILNISRNNVQKTLIIGDINWNLGYSTEPYDSAKSGFLDLLKTAGYTSLISLSKPSTDSGSTIDVAFSNIEGIEGWFYELYFNYHKGICVSVPDI